MKYIITISILLATNLMLLSQQIIFAEDFTNFSDDWSDHTDWTDIDVDNLPVGQYIGGSSDIWVHPGWRYSSSWNCLLSNSRFSTPGQADNWIILPQVSLPNGTSYINWDSWSVSNSLNKKEDFEVLISTTSNNISDFTSILTVTQESYNEVNHSINLSAYSGQDIYIAFRHISNDQYLLCLTNLEIGSSFSNDIKLDKINIPDVCMSPSQITITGTISNLCDQEINSCDINWTVNNGAVNTKSFTSLSMDPFTGTYNFSHSDILNINSVDIFNIKVWVNNPNGSIDGNNTNDTILTTISGLSFTPVKNVLLEEGTGVWCSNCPAGAEEVENIVGSTSNILPVAIHGGDPMQTTEGDDVLNEYFIAYPRAAIDRVKFEDWDEVAISRSDWQNKCNIRKNTKVPADINISSTYDPNNRELSIELTANFYTIMDKEYRLNAYIIEDGILGGSSAEPGYDQNGADDSYIHNHVLRTMLGGAWGTENSVVRPTSDNGEYTYTYNYILPNEYDFNRIHVYGLVQRYTDNNTYDREIVNVKEANILTNTNSIEDNENVNIFPNPCKEYVNINCTSFTSNKIYTVNIYNINGEIVYSKNDISNIRNRIDVRNLLSGMYIIEVRNNNKSFAEKIRIN